MISLDLDAMVAAAHRLLAAHGLTVDGAGDNDRIISPAITSARDVLALADALATAERERDEARAERDTARSALDGLAAAVREYRDAVDHACVARGSEDAGLDVAFAVAEREDDAARAIDALLSAAPAPTTVPAAAVRAYLAAVEAFDGGALGAPCRASIRVDNTRAALVAALEK